MAEIEIGCEFELVRVTFFAADTVPAVWAVKTRLVGLAVRFSKPVPVRPSTSGLPGAPCVIVTVPPRTPGAVGVKITDTLQLAPAAKEAAHVVVWLKSPDAAIERIETGTAWLLVIVALSAGLGLPTLRAENVRLVGERETGAAPSPERGTWCGLPGAFVAIESDPVTVPAATGAK